MNWSMSKIGDSPIERAKAQVDIAAAAADIFPGWTAARSCRSPLRRDRHPSFSVFAEGRKWKDHATGEGGDVVDFIAAARRCDRSEAARYLITLARKSEHMSTKTTSASPTSPRPPAPMPTESRAVWDEGVNHLRANESWQHAIDVWRGWPAGTTARLAEDGLIGTPLVRGRRETAFVVQSPYVDEVGLLSTHNLGLHVRHKSPRGERARWSFDPSGIPSLPFVIGGGFVPFASTIIVCEGQWDAVILAAAAGWLVNDAAWPERISIFGTRGASGWRQLIEAWRHHWRPDVRFILCQDADDAGDTWRAPGGFADVLLKHRHRVRLIRPRADGAKDLSDLNRLNLLTPDRISEWLAVPTQKQ